MSTPSSQVESDGPAPERRRRAAVSLAVLAGISAAFALLFFQVVRPFALPLFLAAVFAVIAIPLHEWISARLGGRSWISALLIPLALLFLLLGPTTAGFVASYRRAVDAVALLERTGRDPGVHHRLFVRLARLTQLDPGELRVRAIKALRDGEQLLFRRAVQAVGNVFSFGLDVLLFLIAVFFFLKDGRSIIEAWEEMTPLTLGQDRQIRREFAVVCRAVVLSTILAALAQALAFGLGLGLLELAFGLGLARWMVLLILLSFICAMIPMLGAPVVWLPLSAWLIYQQQYVAGVSLALIGMLIVSNVDNLVRMLVLRGSAGLHPLLALVSVLGGIQQMGMIGAFIGPVIVGVFVTLLRILKQQLDTFEISSTTPDEPHSTDTADDLRDHLPR